MKDFFATEHPYMHIVNVQPNSAATDMNGRQKEAPDIRKPDSLAAVR